MASSILPPGATTIFARDMNESCSIESHRAKKRLSPAAAAFKSFLVEHGAALIDRVIG